MVACMSMPELVSTEWLAEHIDDANVRVAEVVFGLTEGDEGPVIAGSHAWYWRDVLWDELSRQFPTPEQMAERLGARGISNDTTLVLYSDRPQFAVYGGWVVGVMCGHSDVRILDGGIRKWVAENRPAGERAPTPEKRDYRPNLAVRNDASRIGIDEVQAHLDSERVRIIDLRSPEEYAGERVSPPPGFDHGAARAGHIPGAIHMPATALTRADGSFLSAAELRAVFEEVGATPERATEVVVYCRLGHRASLGWYVMTQLVGWDHVRVYDGSWTEWGNRVGAPVEM